MGYQRRVHGESTWEIGAGIMENPTWKFIFFAAILFQLAISAPPGPPGPPLDFESGWEEDGRPRSATGNNEDLATLITNFLGGQGSSGSNPQDHSGHQNHNWDHSPNPDPPTPTEAYNPVPVAEEPDEPDLPEMVTDVTIGCRLAEPVAGPCASNCLESNAGLCVCPRTQLDCSDAGNTKQCVWLDTTKPNDPSKSGKCIHKTFVAWQKIFGSQYLLPFKTCPRTSPVWTTWTLHHRCCRPLFAKGTIRIRSS